MTGFNRHTKKSASDRGCYKHRSVYSKGRECPGSEKNRSEQTKVGVSQSEQNCDLSINCSDNQERFGSLKLCMLG